MDQGHTSTETPNLSGENAFVESNRDASLESNPFTIPEHSGEPGQLAPGQPAPDPQAIGQNVLESFMPNTAPQAPAAGAEDLNRNPLDPLEVSTPDQSPLTTEPHNITAEQPLANPDSAPNIGSLALEQNKTPHSSEQANLYLEEPAQPTPPEVSQSQGVPTADQSDSTNLKIGALRNDLNAKDPNLGQDAKRILTDNLGESQSPADFYNDLMNVRKYFSSSDEGAGNA